MKRDGLLPPRGIARSRRRLGTALAHQSPGVPASLLLVLLSGVFAQNAAAQSETPAVAAPKLTARLYAAHESVQPGGSTDIAVEIEIEKDWHIYHPVNAEAGAPTRIQIVSDPPGKVTVGPWQFPSPDIQTADELELLVFEGRLVALAKLDVAADMPAGPLKLTAVVRALECNELCVPVAAKAQLTLPVSADAPKPANGTIFSEARDSLPAPLAKSKYVEGSSIAVSKEKLGIGDEVEIVATIKVKSGHHIQDRDPGVEDLIPSRLFIAPVDGLKFGSQQWPKPRIHKAEGVGDVREQAGEAKIRVPVKIIDEQFPSGPVELPVLFHYQCCIDAGSCYPPEWATATLRFVADTPNPPRAAAAAEIPEDLDGSAGGAEAAASGRGGSMQAGGAPGISSALNAAPASWSTLLYMIVCAFVGGMILNITPCVFPVISIKILGFVKQAGEDRGRVLRLGLVFCAGIMVYFWIFGVLTSSGHVPLQHIAVTISLAAILFVMALSLFGVFEILLPGGATTKLDEAATREGYSGAFMNGLLATLLGTACTGPFFAAAAAFAATQPQGIGLLIFTFAGLGMSAPYVLLSAFPGWLKKLPRPGPWMITFKQVMGFVLMATVVFLLYVIGKQLDVLGLVWVISFLCFLAFSAWLVGRIRLDWESGRRFVTWAAALGISAFGLWFCLFHAYDVRHPPQTQESGGSVETIVDRVARADWSKEIPWQPFQPGLAEELARRGYTVFVDYTADWCVNCKTNLKTAVEIDSTRTLMRKLGIIPIIGDYTRENPKIRAELLKYGHNSVPLNLVYPAGQPEQEHVIVLPVLFTPGIVQDALTRAGPSTAKGTLAARQAGFETAAKTAD